VARVRIAVVGQAGVGQRTCAVAFRSRNVELSHSADLHAQATLVPALDHLVDACLVRERLLSRVFGAPELLPGLLNDAGGVHSDRIGFPHLLALALREHLVGGLHPIDLVGQVHCAGGKDQREQAGDAHGHADHGRERQAEHDGTPAACAARAPRGHPASSSLPDREELMVIEECGTPSLNSSFADLHQFYRFDDNSKLPEYELASDHQSILPFMSARPVA
jgi:hypothetical protein